MTTEWLNRRSDNFYTSIVGTGSSGFSLFSLFNDGVIFFKPRHTRFGVISSGSGEWMFREKSNLSWSIR